MKNMNSLRHIAGLYLDLYSQPRDLGRPLSPDEVQEAGRFFLDLIAAHEAELLIAKEKDAAEAKTLPSYRQIAEMFAARYRADNGIDGSLSEDDWYKATDVFLSHISGC
jgi:hypothetical protein